MRNYKMASICYYSWMTIIILLLFIPVDKAATPEGVDQETYCSICKISAEVFHGIAPPFTDRDEWDSEDDQKLMDAWNNLCVYKNFVTYENKHSVKEIIRGCKFLQESSERHTSADKEIVHDSMFEMVKQMVLHKGDIKGMQSAMCYTTSSACKALNKSISDLGGQTFDISPEEIQKILDTPNIRKPSPIRSKPEL